MNERTSMPFRFAPPETHADSHPLFTGFSAASPFSHA